MGLRCSRIGYHWNTALIPLHPLTPCEGSPPAAAEILHALDSTGSQDPDMRRAIQQGKVHIVLVRHAHKPSNRALWRYPSI